jgi:hypothetical protein
LDFGRVETGVPGSLVGVVTMADTRRSQSSSLEANVVQLPSRTHASSRITLLAAALRLSDFTLAWNGLIGACGLVVALLTGSLALAGFALTALLKAR